MMIFVLDWIPASAGMTRGAVCLESVIAAQEGIQSFTDAFHKRESRA